MKHLLKEGKISRLFPEDKEGGGMSGEVHLIRHKKNKYVLRKCKTGERADSIEEMAKKFEKYGFTPRLLGRYKNHLFFEFIEGRDLTSKDIKYAEKAGKILGIIHR